MRMVWQDMSPFPTPRMDAEEEREMRLASQARAGAEWALAALIARYQPPVLRYLTRLTGNTQQSHRLAERLFVRMERRLRGPHGAEHLRLWLLRAATEAGLDVLRHPRRSQRQTQLNAPTGPRGLLSDGLAAEATDRLRAGLGKIAAITGSTRRQVRQLIWNSDDPAAPPITSGDAPQISRAQPAQSAEPPPAVDVTLDSMNPQEELRHRLIRAVLAELPYGDAQCLALHLVAGLNQAEVARALGIRPSAARHRIVQGLQMFAHRYDAAVTSLGVPSEVAYAESAEQLTSPTGDMVDMLNGSPMLDDAYPTPAIPPAPVDGSGYPGSAGNVGTANVRQDAGVAYDEVFPEVYGGEYDLAEVVSAPSVSAPVMESSAGGPPAEPIIVDALPAVPTAGPTDETIEHAAQGDEGDEAASGQPIALEAADTVQTEDISVAPDVADTAHVADAADVPDEQPDAYWLDQPTMVPVLSYGSPEMESESRPERAPDLMSEAISDGTTDALDVAEVPAAAEGAAAADAPAAEGEANSAATPSGAPFVPVLTPPIQP